MNIGMMFFKETIEDVLFIQKKYIIIYLTHGIFISKVNIE